MNNELNVMVIRTTQRTKTLYYTPNGGCKRGVDYKPVENEVLRAVTERIRNSEIYIVPSQHRYFEFYFTYDVFSNKNFNDLSTDLRECVQIMSEVAEQFDLKLIQASM